MLVIFSAKCHDHFQLLMLPTWTFYYSRKDHFVCVFFNICNICLTYNICNRNVLLEFLASYLCVQLKHISDTYNSQSKSIMSLVPLLLQSLILSTCFSFKDENRTGGGENLTVSLFLRSLILFQVFWWLVGAATRSPSRCGFLMKMKPLPEAPRTKKPLWKMTSHVDCLGGLTKELNVNIF